MQMRDTLQRTAQLKARHTRLVNVGASASLPRRRWQLSGAVSVVSSSWPSRYGLGRRLPVVAEVEVGGEPVSQVLGGEAVQRCHGHGSCKRGDIVSLIIDALHELRQRRPVALSEESLVDLAGQRRPPLLR